MDDLRDISSIAGDKSFENHGNDGVEDLENVFADLELDLSRDFSAPSFAARVFSSSENERSPAEKACATNDPDLVEYLLELVGSRFGFHCRLAECTKFVECLKKIRLGCGLLTRKKYEEYIKGYINKHSDEHTATPKGEFIESVSESVDFSSFKLGMLCESTRPKLNPCSLDCSAAKNSIQDLLPDSNLDDIVSTLTSQLIRLQCGLIEAKEAHWRTMGIALKPMRETAETQPVMQLFLQHLIEILGAYLTETLIARPANSDKLQLSSVSIFNEAVKLSGYTDIAVEVTEQTASADSTDVGVNNPERWSRVRSIIEVKPPEGDLTKRSETFSTRPQTLIQNETLQKVKGKPVVSLCCDLFAAYLTYSFSVDGVAYHFTTPRTVVAEELVLMCMLLLVDCDSAKLKWNDLLKPIPDRACPPDWDILVKFDNDRRGGGGNVGGGNSSSTAGSIRSILGPAVVSSATLVSKSNGTSGSAGNKKQNRGTARVIKPEVELYRKSVLSGLLDSSKIQGFIGDETSAANKENASGCKVRFVENVTL